MTNQMLKYFWKYLGFTFLIELLWYIATFSIGYFTSPAILRHISMVGFLVIPFIAAYHTMWKKIDELEAYAKAKVEEEFAKKIKLNQLENSKEEIKISTEPKAELVRKRNVLLKDKKIIPKKTIQPKLDNNDEEETF